MLVLTRRDGESLIIGDNIKITVLAQQGNQVKIGILAPRDVTVHREEIYRKILNTKVVDDRKEDAAVRASAERQQDEALSNNTVRITKKIKRPASTHNTLSRRRPST